MRLVAGFLLAIFVLIGCDKDDDYSSILGEWYVEDFGDVSDFHRYTVSIQRIPSDSTLYRISNFYRTGVSTELIVQVNGPEIVINGQTIGNYYFQGEGDVADDYKNISIEYQVTGPISEAVLSEFTRR